MKPLAHAEQCGWHFDQYDFECTCGVTRPATLAWAQTELLAAHDRAKRAIQDFEIAEARFNDMFASVGRNAERQDRKDGLGRNDEHAVSATSAETPRPWGADEQQASEMIEAVKSTFSPPNTPGEQ